MAERQPEGRNARRPQKQGTGTKQVALIIAGVLLFLFFVLNFQKVRVHLLITTVQMPLVIALVIAAALGWLLGWAVPRMRRDKSNNG